MPDLQLVTPAPSTRLAELVEMNPIMLAQVLGHAPLVMIQRNYAHSTPADPHEMLAMLLAGD